MPLYTYTCTSCDTTVEKRQSFSDAPLTTCESCGGALRKVIHPVGIVFKGSGWYVTDSRSSTNAASGTAKKDDASKSESSSSDSETKSSESKSSTSDAKSTASESKASTPAASSATS